MKETDCRKCCVCAFKESLCEGYFCEKYYREGSVEDFEKLLPHWIPCSERLPEDKCDVLIQFGWNMAVGCIDGGDWRINSGDAWCTEVAEDDGKPIAWTPLPEPYKEGADK